MKGRIALVHVGEEATKNPVGPVYVVDQTKGKQEGKNGNTCCSGRLLPGLKEIEKEEGCCKDQQAMNYNKNIETVRSHIFSVLHTGWFGKCSASALLSNDFPCIFQ